MSYRLEEKIPLTYTDVFILKRDLMKKGLSVLYEGRTVRSIYFDNYHKGALRDSDEGVLPRKKIRVREYPDHAEKEYVLEQKISSVEGRYKSESVKLAVATYYTLLQDGIVDNMYGICFPCVIIEYWREYYKLGNVRLTIDTNIQYKAYDQDMAINEDLSVMEIKASDYVSTDYLLHIIPIPRRRFSKYANARHILHI